MSNTLALFTFIVGDVLFLGMGQELLLKYLCHFLISIEIIGKGFFLFVFFFTSLKKGDETQWV